MQDDTVPALMGVCVGPVMEVLSSCRGDDLGNVSCARPSVHAFRARFGSVWWRSGMVPGAQPCQRLGGRCRGIIGKAGGARWDYELNRRLLEVVRRKAVRRDSMRLGASDKAPIGREDRHDARG